MTISVVTVAYNAAQTIERTIASVLAQTYPHIEYLIVDGASTDGTMAIVDRYRDRLAGVISEPDQGIYDAMNKGLARATGEYLYFLNADDQLYAPDTVATVMEAFARTPESDFLYGDIVMQEPETGAQRIYRYDAVDRLFLYLDCICQQAIFYRRRAFARCGVFDTTFRVAGDYEWLLRAMLAYRLPTHYLGMPVTYFSLGGISCGGNPELDAVIARERYQVIDAYFGGLERAIYVRKRFRRHFMAGPLRRWGMRLFAALGPRRAWLPTARSKDAV